MSHPRPSSKKPDTQRRITNVIDHTNIDDFFSQPSPHELTATSERRVQEIIEDLKRLTAEEIKNWSWKSPVDKDFEAAEPLDHTTEKTKTISDGDMVSSPVSLLPAPSSPLLPSTVSNCPAAFPTESEIHSRSKSDRPIRSEASLSSSQAKLLRASDRRSEPNRTTAKVISSGGHVNASLPLPVKRRAKAPPPIPIIARDFAYQCPRTPLEDPRTPPLPPPVTPATPSRALQQIAQAEQVLNFTNPTSESQPSASHKQTLIALVNGPAIRDTDTSISSIHAAPVAPLRIKRKPLPADSPLLIPLKEHPAFAMSASDQNGPWL